MRAEDMYRTVGRPAWRVWLATALLLVGVSFAADGALAWRVVGCVALLWVPLLIIDHCAAMIQDVIDHTARDLDARDGALWAAYDALNGVTSAPEAAGGRALLPVAEPAWPAGPQAPDNDDAGRAAVHYAASVGASPTPASGEDYTAVLDPITDATAVMPPLDPQAPNPDTEK